MQAGFVKDVVQMELYRGATNTHSLGNSPVLIALGHQPQCLHLPGGEVYLGGPRTKEAPRGDLRGWYHGSHGLGPPNKAEESRGMHPQGAALANARVVGAVIKL